MMTFYNKDKIAIIPIDFCYPVKVKQETYHHCRNVPENGWQNVNANELTIEQLLD